MPAGNLELYLDALRKGALGETDLRKRKSFFQRELQEWIAQEDALLAWVRRPGERERRPTLWNATHIAQAINAIGYEIGKIDDALCNGAGGVTHRREMQTNVVPFPTHIASR